MTNKEIYHLILDNGARVITDSRNVERGDVFFALKGDKFNGNEYAEDALGRGAIRAIVDDVRYMTDRTILADDVLTTLQDVARIHRQSLEIPVLAITGTNGKTTTKELIARVLSRKYKLHFTDGNLNNHIGVPLTILGAGANTTFLVVEMGANHIGEITDLCNIALPDAGLITNIGKAHLEGFGSFEGVIKAKSELYNFLSENDGTIIYNDSNPLLKELVTNLDIKSVSYSNPGGLLKVKDITQGRSLSIELSFNRERFRVDSSLAGIHNAENILAAVTVGLVYGVEMKNIIDAIETYKPDNNRSQLLKTENNLLFCDAYNANPDSMALALDSFLKSDADPKTVIIGDMMELGEYSLEEHKLLINRLLGIDNISIYLVGPILCDMAGDSGLKVFSDTDLLISDLKRNPIKNNFVFIKGSRGIGLESIFAYL